VKEWEDSRGNGQPREMGKQPIMGLKMHLETLKRIRISFLEGIKRAGIRGHQEKLILGKKNHHPFLFKS